MKNNKSILVVILIFLSMYVCGCASVGRSFKYENIQQLQLGEFKIADYQSVFGKPKNVSNTSNKDGKFTSVRYLYAYADIGTARARLLDLEFKNDVLNGYNYLSSFDKDKTEFNTESVNQITVGKSKMVDVINILGKPHGKARCPSTLADYKTRCEEITEVWSWATMEKMTTLGKHESKTITVFISFDSDGIVSDIETTEDGI